MIFSFRNTDREDDDEIEGNDGNIDNTSHNPETLVVILSFAILGEFFYLDIVNWRIEFTIKNCSDKWDLYFFSNNLNVRT